MQDSSNVDTVSKKDSEHAQCTLNYESDVRPLKDRLCMSQPTPCFPTSTPELNELSDVILCVARLGEGINDGCIRHCVTEHAPPRSFGHHNRNSKPERHHLSCSLLGAINTHLLALTNVTGLHLLPDADRERNTTQGCGARYGLLGEPLLLLLH